MTAREDPGCWTDHQNTELSSNGIHGGLIRELDGVHFLPWGLWNMVEAIPEEAPGSLWILWNCKLAYVCTLERVHGVLQSFKVIYSVLFDFFHQCFIVKLHLKNAKISPMPLQKFGCAKFQLLMGCQEEMLSRQLDLWDKTVKCQLRTQHQYVFGKWQSQGERRFDFLDLHFGIGLREADLDCSGGAHTSVSALHVGMTSICAQRQVYDQDSHGGTTAAVITIASHHCVGLVATFNYLNKHDRS